METVLDIIFNILSLLLTLGILVTIHEFGHFWVARRCGVKVECFSIGFGKSIYSWTRGETEYRIAMLPLGGYVKMFGHENTDVEESERDRAFNFKPLYQRFLIVAAGPMANFVLAIVLYWFMFVSGVNGIAPIIGSIINNSPAAEAGFSRGEEIIAVDGESTETWQQVQFQLLDRLGETGVLSLTVKGLDSQTSQTKSIQLDRWLIGESEPDVLSSLGFSLDIPAIIGEIIPDGQAEYAGLEVNDRIIAVDGVELRGWMHWVELIRANPESEMQISLVRNGINMELVLRPALNVDANGNSRGYIGAGVQESGEWLTERKVSYSVFKAIPQALSETWSNSVFVLVSIKKMIIGLISVENLSGPITIAQVAGQTVSYGLIDYISFLAILSISLGVLNLLPIPVLDGGHLFFYIIEAIIRRPIPEKIQAMGMQFGVLLIAGIMCIAFYNDVNRFF